MYDSFSQCGMTLGFSLPLSSLLAVSALAVLVLTALLLSLILLFQLKRDQSRFVTLGGLASATLLTLQASGTTYPEVALLSFLKHDSYATFLQVSLLLVAGILALVGDRYFRQDRDVVTEFHLLLVLGTLGLHVMVAANDFLTLTVGLEIAALAAIVMTGALRPTGESRTALFPWFLGSLVGSAVLWMGVAYLYGTTGTFSLPRIGALSARALSSSWMFSLGAGFVLCGFAIKASLAPFHLWTPDLHEHAPTPVSAFLSVSFLGGVLAVMAKVTVLSLDSLSPHFLNLLLGSLVVFGVLLANYAALKETQLKRILAYSSLSHAGYLLLAVALRSATPSAGPTLLFAFLSYLLMTLGAYGFLMVFESGARRSLSLADIHGLGRRYPAMSACFAVFLLSLGAVPPTLGFAARWELFKVALSVQLPVMNALVLIAAVASLVGAYVFLRVLKALFSKTQPAEPLAASTAPFPFEQRISLALAVALLLLGFFPQSLQLLASSGKLPPVAKKAAEQFALAKLRKAPPRSLPRTPPRGVQPPKEPRSTVPPKRRASAPVARPKPTSRPTSAGAPARQNPPTTRPTTRPVGSPSTRPSPTTRPTKRASVRKKVVIKALLPLKATRIPEDRRRRGHTHHHGHGVHDHGAHKHGARTTPSRPRVRSAGRPAQPPRPAPASKPTSRPIPRPR